MYIINRNFVVNGTRPKGNFGPTPLTNVIHQHRQILFRSRNEENKLKFHSLVKIMKADRYILISHIIFIVEEDELYNIYIIHKGMSICKAALINHAVTIAVILFKHHLPLVEQSFFFHLTF